MLLLPTDECGYYGNKAFEDGGKDLLVSDPLCIFSLLVNIVLHK